MHIICCVKQVPATTEVTIDPVTNTIVREGAEAVINPCDAHALEEGLRIKEKKGGRLTVLSMGIPAAARMLWETLAMGADEAILLSDRAFAGADVLATAYTLSQGIRCLGHYDLILCGRRAVDGDTAQVGPALAEKLGIPHATCVRRIKGISPSHLRCERLTEEGSETLEMELPALITVVEEINEPRLPSIPGLIQARGAAVQIWDAKRIGAERDLCGLQGSATRVVRTFAPQYESEAEIIEGLPWEQARILAERICDLSIGSGR